MIGLFAALLKSIEYTLFIIFTTTWNASHAFGATCYKADLWWNHGEICQVLFTRNFSYFACSSKDSSRCMVPSQERLLGCSSRYALVKDIDNLSFKQCFLQWRAWHQQNSPPQQRISHVLKRYRGGWISPAKTNFCLSSNSHSGCIIAPGLHNQSFVDPKAWTYKQWNMDRRPLAVRWSFEELKWTTKISGAVESCRPIHECRLAKSTIGGLTLDWNRRKSAAWWPVYS